VSGRADGDDPRPAGGPVPVGREAEARRVREFLVGLGTGSRSLILEGELGIGKTTLLEWGRGFAVTQDVSVLRSEPVEAEFPLEFAGLADLFQDLPSAVLETLPSPQQHALRVAVLRTETPDSALDARTIATAGLNVLRALAASRPVLVVVDDLPWMDLPSARVLSFVFRRTRDAPIGLLAAARTGLAGESAVVPALDGLDQAGVERVRLGPLTDEALRALLADLRIDGPSFRGLVEGCGGNPLFALELATRARTSVSTDHPVILAVPPSLRRLALERIGATSARQRQLLLVVALAENPDVTLLQAVVGSQPGIDEDLEGLTRSGLLVRDADRIGFGHPLLRAVVAEEASLGQRRAVHLRLAGAARSREGAARHLGLGTSGHDEGIAHELEHAALVAARRGACDTAAQLADLAVARTPPGRGDDRRRRIVSTAEYAFEASEPARARALIATVIDELEPGRPRAELLRREARYLIHSGERFAEWMRALTAALDEAGDDTAFRAEVLLDIGVVYSNIGDQVSAFDYGMQTLELARVGGHEALEAQAAAGMAWGSFLGGQGLDAETIERLATGPDQPPRLAMELRPNIVIGHILHLVGDLDRARALYHKEYQRSKEEGVETGLPLLLWGLVETEAYAGNWAEAERLAAEGCQLAEESASPPATALMTSVRGLVHVYRGRIDAGLRDAEQALEMAETLDMVVVTINVSQYLGLAHLSVGDAEGAYRRLRPFAEAWSTTGVGEPTVHRYLPDAIEALVGLGDLDAADGLLDAFEARSEQLGRCWGVATAGRCRGLLHAARGDLDAATDVLEAAEEAHRELPLPFERARTLLALGRVHRRARRKTLAQNRLSEALAVFESIGAPLWAEQARNDLGRVGVRRADGAELTAAERRVADLVATGLTNAQVATRLFMAPRTVEAHLTRIYRKLGVHTRTEMSGHLGPSRPDPPKHVGSTDSWVGGGP
jgi:DNA-binding CsgD family transcriptional regulator